jgi:hypothetical protein
MAGFAFLPVIASEQRERGNPAVATNGILQPIATSAAPHPTSMMTTFLPS